MYESITLHFSPAHAKKILKGGACQLDIEHLCGTKGYPLEVQVHKTVGNRLRKAAKLGKAARVYSHEIIPLEGGGKFIDWFKNLGQKIQEGYSKVKPFLAPIVKEAATKLADVGTAAVAPYLPSSVNTLIQENKGKAVDALGNITGAYGCPHCRGGAMMIPSRGVYYPQPYSNWSTQAMPLSPAMTSKIAYPGWGYPADYDGLGANGMSSGASLGTGFKVI